MINLRALLIIAFAAVCVPQLCRGQQLPAVKDLIKKHDSDRNGVLSAAEVAESTYKRQFPRWDANKDGAVSAAEIIAFRRRFGIAADGSRLNPNANRNANRNSSRMLPIPAVSELARIGAGKRPTRDQARNSAFVLATESHAVTGRGYWILTDHNDEKYLDSIAKLARHRDAQVIRVDDLGQLAEESAALQKLHTQFQAAPPRFVAVAPRIESFRENTLLALWELFATLDDDPQIDVLPGLLLASNPTSFSRLVDQSIAHRPLSKSALQPFALSQVPSVRELRSLQKAGILRKHFAAHGVSTPTLAVYTRDASEAPRIDGEQITNVVLRGKRDFVKAFAAPVAKQFADANLVVMHGHGIPGMSCSVDIAAIPDNCQGKFVLTGSCFSASPRKSDWPALRQAPGGYSVEQRDAFVVRAVDRGALVGFGHMRLSSGFPHLFPVLETWLHGGTVGAAYQELLNGLIETTGTRAGGFVVNEKARPAQNVLLYVVIGDPALQPFQRLTK